MSRVTTIYEGKVRKNIYGNWSDVDRGWWIGDDNVTNFLYDYLGRRVRVTVEILPEEDHNAD